MELKNIVFIDAEIGGDQQKILDLGAVKADGAEFHANSSEALADFVKGNPYVCGHNILKHDLKYLQEIAGCGAHVFIDTLYISPLIFPQKQQHKLLKDDKLLVDELNNPLNDAKKARDLLYTEVDAFRRLEPPLQRIFAGLLADKLEFEAFFKFIGRQNMPGDTAGLIREAFEGKICANAPVAAIANEYPVELAYALALINVIEHSALTPPWLLKNYPRVENVLHQLRGRQCPSCAYCDESLDEQRALKKFFHYDAFRTYDSEALQQNAVRAAVAGTSLLAVFPTGGGKSITFQLPALMAGDNEKGLTVVISPLQSLMKDQTDNLEQQHQITEAVTINGSLDPVERAKAFDRVEDCSASLLYISPESLRSKSIERLLLGRNIVRVVIDEAHCFSAWGQDFRVDYLYIGEFIRSVEAKKGRPHHIPVSCFTATAKQRVIEDIRAYFKEQLSLELEVFQASAARVNLQYHIFIEDSPAEKDLKLRQLLADNDCPAIVYVSRTRRAEQLAKKLVEEGFAATAYHGKMDKQLRTANQDIFMRGDVNIIVATTAFGMGVDKKDVGMVIHYDISDSLENYVQEAGRAGRDENIQADCYVLYTEEDLNKHFLLLNQTRLSRKEIQQIWKALKDLMKQRPFTSQSALEIARAAGWDDTVSDMETRVKTAVNALEQANLVKRGQNMPRIFADSILVKNMDEARRRIDSSPRFDNASRMLAGQIIGNLISARSKAKGQEEDGESRVDYIADRLGTVKADVIRVIGLLREEKILADAKDLVAYIKKTGRNHSLAILSAHKNLESFLFGYLADEEKTYNIKEMNEAAQAACPEASPKRLGAILNYFAIKRFIKRTPSTHKNHVIVKPYGNLAELRARSAKRCEIAVTILGSLYRKAHGAQELPGREDLSIEFSVLELKEEWNSGLLRESAEAEEIEDALYYLLKIGALKIEGGFLVIYNAMRLERLEKDNRAQYKQEHYRRLDEYYRNKRQQIHIVGEYAKRLLDGYREAMAFVEDYFAMEYTLFLHKYFKGRQEEIDRNITPKKYKQLFGELSAAQFKIIENQHSQYIVVAAGPGSGKTKLLTHKLASLYMMEDVKHEQMLMLTFSRASATEFKLRLMKLIGNAANFIQITTFHAYCFDVLGKVGDLEKSDTIIDQTIERINAGEVDLMRLTKTVLVIDEAQDMSAAEYRLVRILMEKNSDLRIIAVGDDDQNIYEFRGSRSDYFTSLAREAGAATYELTCNYRSRANIVHFANQFTETIPNRFKTVPITAATSENGKIEIRKLAGDAIEIPAARALLETMPSGRSCLMTRTNEEALNIAGLLQQKGISARLIQSNRDFNLYNLVELRDFCENIDRGAEAYTIDEETWQRALAALQTQYAASHNLPGVLKLLGDFAQSHNKVKYKTDFRQFIRESKLEDFVSNSDGTIFVSTIHQSKGREFDNVFLALSRFQNLSDENRRAMYVALTRAKQNLYILYNGEYFDSIQAENLSRSTDPQVYSKPPLICRQLSHKDVHLGHFSSHQDVISSLMSGEKLAVCDTGCLCGGKHIIRFSATFCEQLGDLKAKGYNPSSACVRHIVFWRGKNQENEIKIVLPNLEFSNGTFTC